MSASVSNSANLVPAVSGGVAHGPVSATPERVAALSPDAKPTMWTGERLLAVEAMHLLIRLDRELLEARAQWNQDWFRRIMRIRPKAVQRLQRRWANLSPKPAIPLGSLRRRYHANLAGYLYERK
jgi:hypothetical protein